MKFTLIKDITKFLTEGVHSDYAKSLSNDDLLKHLETHADPNDKNSDHWADRKAAAIKELHKRHTSGQHPDLSKHYDRLISFHSDSPSPYVKRTVGSITGQTLVKPKTAPVVKQKETKAEKSETPVKKKSLPSTSKLDTSIHPEGKYDKAEGNTSEYPGSSKVSRLVHKTQDGKVREVATIVSDDSGHHIYKDGKKVEGPKHISHSGAMTRAIQNDRDSR